MNRTHEDDEYEYFEEPSEVAAVGRAIKRGGLQEFGEEAQGWLESTFPRLQLTPGDFFDPRVSTPTAPTYQRARDNARSVDDATRDAHPALSTATELGVALLHPLNKVGGGGLRGAVAGGALQGGLTGLGASRADLTDADVLNYVQALKDTGKGALLGGGVGAAAHGVGAGLRALGRKTGDVLDSARERLFREESEAGMREMAERDAQEIARREAQRAAQAKEKARLEREHGQALEMNKGLDKRAARAEQRAASARTEVVRGMQEPRAPRGRGEAPALSEEPSTKQLGGYHRQAFNEVAERQLKGQAFRRDMDDVNTAVRQDWERYIAEFPEALENPALARRMVMERNLRMRYGDEMAERIMSERVGPDGSIRSRGMAAEPKTLPAGYEDVALQGRAQKVARQGGGGSMWDEYEPRTEAGAPDFSDYEVPHASPMWRENLAREVEREGVAQPHWRNREPGERPLTPYENAQLDAQNPRTAPWEETDVVYGYPPEEDFRFRPSMPEAEDFAVDASGPARRAPAMEPLPARRAAGERLHDFSGRPPRAVFEAPTNPGGGAEPRPLPELAPLEVSLGRGEPPTLPMGYEDVLAQGRVEDVRRMGGGGSAFEARTRAERPAPQGRPEPTVAQRPSWMPPAPRPGEVPRLGAPPKDEEVVYQYLQSLESPAMQRAQAREQGALGQVASVGYEGMKGSGNVLGAMAGAAVGITRESLRNPAVRARALSTLRLRRLASVEPAVFARVGRALEQALQQGPDEYAATVHVYNQTDPDFREAERRASEGTDGITDEQLEAELQAAGLL